MDKELVKEHVEGHQGRQLRTRTVRIHETGGANRHGSRKQVARAATLSLPPDGSFDDHDVCWERAKFLRESDAYKYAWIPQARLEDFREGLRKKTVDCSYFLQQSRVRMQTERGNDDLPGRNVNMHDRWLRCEEWHCECGPGSTQLTPDEMIASSMRVPGRSTPASAKFTQVGVKRLVVQRAFLSDIRIQVLILMNAQQGRWLWRCGHNHGIQLDSTFNTVRSRFSVFTICVMHASGYLPCAWFITSDECTETIAYCLRTLVQRLADDAYHPICDTWCPAVAMIRLFKERVERVGDRPPEHEGVLVTMARPKSDA